VNTFKAYTLLKENYFAAGTDQTVRNNAACRASTYNSNSRHDDYLLSEGFSAMRRAASA
jgi:hypothetical protein